MKLKYQLDNISDNNFEQCVKCTICTIYCPVTPVNVKYPGPKQAGPDGERYRLKKPEYYDEGLKYCLNCKRCEVACPSNVRIGDIIQKARFTYSRGSVKLRDRMLASTDFVGSMAVPFAPVVNATLKLKPVRWMLGKTLGIAPHREMPAYSPKKFTTWFKRHAKNKQASMPRQITYFHGCYVQYNYPQLGKDFVAVMNALGVGVRLMEKERCCGVAKIANLLVDQVKTDASRNLNSIREAVAEGTDVVGTSSTCIFTMRDEYSHVLGLDNADVRNNISLAMRLVYKLIVEENLPVVWRKDFKMKAAYHTACHMSRLGWSIYTLGVLRRIPGLQLTKLPQQCCGIAGTYGFKKENYEYSQEIGSILFDEIARVNPLVVITECETCKWQIESSTGRNVLNPISIIAQALDLEATAKLNQ